MSIKCRNSLMSYYSFLFIKPAKKTTDADNNLPVCKCIRMVYADPL